MKDTPATAGGETCVIPKDDMVLVSPSVGMRLPEVLKDPGTFDPDRLGPGREERKAPHARLGFGGGMHLCMGQNFGCVQVKTILSVIMRESEMEMISPEMPDVDYEAMAVGPKGDCRV